jgi:lipoprotein
MKKLTYLIFAVVLTVALSACDMAAESQENDIQPTAEQAKVDWLIAEYNKKAENPITEVTEFDVRDRDNGHYRVEFRLTAFDEAEAKTGKIGDMTIDLVCYGYDLKEGGYTNQDIRLYADGVTSEQAKEIVKIASPILDSSLTDADVEEVLRKINEGKELNGYYYGELCLSLINGEFMLKAE